MPQSYWNEVRTFEKQVYDSADTKKFMTHQKQWLGGSVVGQPDITHYNGMRVPSPAGLFRGRRIVALYSDYNVQGFKPIKRTAWANIRPGKERLATYVVRGTDETQTRQDQEMHELAYLALMPYTLGNPSELTASFVRSTPHDHDVFLEELKRGASGEFNAV